MTSSITCSTERAISALAAELDQKARIERQPDHVFSMTLSTEIAAMDFVSNLDSRGYTETAAYPIQKGSYKRTFRPGVFIVEWNETKEHEARAMIYELEVLRTMARRKSTDGRCRWEGCNRKTASAEGGLCKGCLARLADLEGRNRRAA